MKKKIIFFTLLVLLFSQIFAQSSNSSTISKLKAKLLKSSTTNFQVVLTWEVPKKSYISAYLIYRDTTQITRHSIESLKPIIKLTGKYTTYTDTIQDINIPYFYCVLTETKNSSVFDVIIPTVNSTVTPIKIVNSKTDNSIIAEPNINEPRENERALIPLPYLTDKNAPFKDTNSIKNEMLTLPVTVSNKKNNKGINIQILDKDVKPDSGDQYLLSTIVNTDFKEKKWSSAEKQLIEFLKINRDEDTVSRAYFYLGQIYHFQGKNKNAIECFMYSQDKYSIESKKWLEIALSDYQIPTSNE